MVALALSIMSLEAETDEQEAVNAVLFLFAKQLRQ